MQVLLFKVTRAKEQCYSVLSTIKITCILQPLTKQVVWVGFRATKARSPTTGRKASKRNKCFIVISDSMSCVVICSSCEKGPG